MNVRPAAGAHPGSAGAWARSGCEERNEAKTIASVTNICFIGLTTSIRRDEISIVRMSAEILELYPPAGMTRALDGTYLAHDLHSLGTPGQPAIAIVSRTLDFPVPPSLEQHEQPVHIITGEGAPPDRVNFWRARGCEVVLAGAGASVEGAPLLIGGEMFHTLTAGSRLGSAGRLQLHTLYYDVAAPEGTGQWFASFDLRESHAGKAVR